MGEEGNTRVPGKGPGRTSRRCSRSAELPRRLPLGELRDHMQYLCNKHGLDRFYPTGPGRAGDGRQRHVLPDRHAVPAPWRAPPTRRSASRSTPGEVATSDADDELKARAPAGCRGGARRAARRLPRLLPGREAVHRRRSSVDRRHAPRRVARIPAGDRLRAPGLGREVHDERWRRPSAMPTRSRRPTSAATSSPSSRSPHESRGMTAAGSSKMLHEVSAPGIAEVSGSPRWESVIRTSRSPSAYSRLAAAWRPGRPLLELVHVRHLGVAAGGPDVRGEDLLDELAARAGPRRRAAAPGRVGCGGGSFGADSSSRDTRLGRLMRRLHTPFDAFELASDAVARGNRKVFARSA